MKQFFSEVITDTKKDTSGYYCYTCDAACTDRCVTACTSNCYGKCWFNCISISK